jgi:2-succinyl-5-enolpyruvyl-6-hydroxy-3-cyclohexene-1-carboxylate synthase
VVGRPTLSRGVRGLMGTVPVYGVGDNPQWTEPQYVAEHVRGWLDLDDLSHVDGSAPDWSTSWLTADVNAASAADKLLDEEPWPSGLAVARDLMAALPAGATLFLGSSNPIRDVDLLADPRSDVAVYANRGVAGIDGNLSTAAGLALAGDVPCYALVGDLTFLHDLNALAIGPTETRPRLTVVVVNDDGGGIFALLEQGSAEHAAAFERVFGTPVGADLAALCAGYHVPHTLARTPSDLRTALTTGPRVIEVRPNRAALRDLHARLKATVLDAALR